MNNYLFISLILFIFINLCISQSSNGNSSGDGNSNSDTSPTLTNNTCSVYSEVRVLRVCDVGVDLQIQGGRNCSKIDIILDAIKKGGNFTKTTDTNCFYALSKLLCSINCVQCNISNSIQPKVCVSKLCRDFVERCYATGIGTSITDCVNEMALPDDPNCTELGVLLDLDAAFRRSSFSINIKSSIPKSIQITLIIISFLFLFI